MDPIPVTWDPFVSASRVFRVPRQEVGLPTGLLKQKALGPRVRRTAHSVCPICETEKSHV